MQASSTTTETIDLSEHGGKLSDSPQTCDRRLFMQFSAFKGVSDPTEVLTAVQASSLTSAVYLDVNDPQSVGIITMTEDPNTFITTQRELFNSTAFSGLTQQPELTMLGRTYSTGYEADLEDWLLRRQVRNVLDEKCDWAVWYPLRRAGEFNLLPGKDQAAILREHGAIGRMYGEAGLAHDIRLACHGLDKNDNDFVIGITVPELYIASKLIQHMRKTQQTGKYIESLGPFFVGKVIWRSPLPF